MTDSVSEQLHKSMECEGVLGCLYGLRELERECYSVLVDASSPLTVDEIADEIDRERSTAYRSVQRLCAIGFVRKEKIDYEDGGYYHVYQPADPAQVAHDMQQTLNSWYAKMGQLIGEFEEKYENADEVVPDG